MTTSTPVHPSSYTIRTDGGYRTITENATMLDEVEGLIHGYVFIWGTPSMRDEYKTYFDKARPPETATNDGMHRRPISYEHAMDGVVRKEIVGVIDRVWYDDVGLAYEGHLYRDNPFFLRIVRELARNELKTSSATMDHTAEFYEDGAFRDWWLGELALTKTPAETRMPASVLVRSAEGQQAAVRAEDAQPIRQSSIFERSNKHMGTKATTKPVVAVKRNITPEQALALETLVQEQGISVDDLLAYLAQAQVPEEALEPDVTPEELFDELLSSARTHFSALSKEQKRDADLNARFVNLEKMIKSLARADANQSEDEEDEESQTRAEGDPEDEDEEKPEEHVAASRKRNAPPSRTNPAKRHASTTRTVTISDVQDRRFDHLSASDMWFVRSLLGDNGVEVSPEFNRAMAHKTMRSLEADRAPLSAEYRATIRSRYTRADDFMASNIANQGQDWTSIFYADQIWEKARVECLLLAELTSRGMHVVEVPDGHESAVIFLESSDMQWFTTAQSNDRDATYRPEVTTNIGFIGSGQVSVTPGQLTAAVAFTDILEEDSLIPIAAQINRQFQDSAVEIIEYAILNGDTATTVNTNINLIDDTPGTGISKPAYLVSDGVLKLPLVTQTTLSRDAGGVFNESTFKATQMKLAAAQRAKKDKQLFVMDPDTYDTALMVPALKTVDVAGNDATIQTGELRNIWGVKPIRSGQMGLANAAGKISKTAGNNLYGRLLDIYAPYFALVWKRQLSFENARFALSQSSAIVGSLRMATRRRGNDAATLTYNIPIGQTS